MPNKKKKDETKEDNHYQQNDELLKHWVDYNRWDTAIPRTMRLSEPSAFLLEAIAVQLGTSSSKVLTEILEDVLPKFLEDPAEESISVEISLLKHYRTLKHAGVLRPGNPEELKMRIRSVFKTDPAS